MAILTDLSEDAIMDIYSRLPVKSLLRLLSVNRYFYNVISNPRFWYIHCNKESPAKHNCVVSQNGNVFSFYAEETFRLHNRVSFPAPALESEYEVLGLSKGLLLLSTPNISISNWELCLWNPCIKKVKILPRFPPGNPSSLPSHVAFAFGFVERLSDYLTIKVSYFGSLDLAKPENSIVVDIHSLATNSWKRLEGFPPYIVVREIAGVIVKGIAYWYAVKLGSDNELERLVASFDTSNETLQEIRLPRCVNETCSYIRQLVEFHGELHMFVKGPYMDNGTWHVWVLNEGGREMNWSKKFTIAFSQRPAWPLYFVQDGAELLQRDGFGLSLYNPEYQEARPVEFTGYTFSVYPKLYSESLTLLDSRDGEILQRDVAVPEGEGLD